MMMRRRGPGLVGVAARTAVVAGTATAVSGRVAGASRTSTPRRSSRRLQPRPSRTLPPPEYMEELEQLAQLRDQGILSPEEFEAKKKQILGI